MIKLTFYGAARGVTGSKHLLEVNGRRVLIECGLFQGPRTQSEQQNRTFAFDPTKVDAVLLSHAHIDHAGNLPNLVKQGFRGSIHATDATADLAALMLADAAHIQLSDVKEVNQNEKRQGKDQRQPLYTAEDVEHTVELFVPHHYREAFDVVPGVRCTFRDAGHILGSAVLILDIEDGGKTKRLGFTGDLGRSNFPVLKDPEAIGATDVLMTETTYGARYHGSWEQSENQLVRLVLDAVEEHGKLIIPAFSVGRTQLLTFFLHKLIEAKRIPRVPVYVDSPLAANATQAYLRHPECLDPGVVEELSQDKDPYGFHLITYIRSQEESKALNDQHGPMLILAGSGMCEHGRIVHHLAHGVGDPRNTVLLAGYQAQGTLGRRIQEGATDLMMFGKMFKRRCRVQMMEALSAHAGRGELEQYVRGLARPPQRAILVHGEPDQMEPFADWLQHDRKITTAMPAIGESLEL